MWCNGDFVYKKYLIFRGIKQEQKFNVKRYFLSLERPNGGPCERRGMINALGLLD
jgi:hypothetical protein